MPVFLENIESAPSAALPIPCEIPERYSEVQEGSCEDLRTVPVLEMANSEGIHPQMAVLWVASTPTLLPSPAVYLPGLQFTHSLTSTQDTLQIIMNGKFKT